MNYKIGYTPKALKQLSRLDKSVVRRVRLFMDGLDRQNPRLVGKPLKGGSGFWRYRVGDYRILVSIGDGEMLVLVIDVDHRQQVYRDL